VSEEILSQILAVQSEQTKVLGEMQSDIKNVCKLVEKHDSDIDDLKSVKNRAYGFMAAFGGLEGLYHYLVHKFHL
jgi:hypothetical protein